MPKKIQEQLGDSSPESPLKARGETKFSHFSLMNKVALEGNGVYSSRYQPDGLIMAIGQEDGTLSFISNIGAQISSVKDNESHGPIMDIAWKKRTSLMEPNHMIAARADGTISKWRSDESCEEVENIPLNRSNQYMTCDFQ